MTTPQDDGGTIASGMEVTTQGESQRLIPVGGLSIRDWFAGMALQGLLASGHFTYPPEGEDNAWMTTHLDEIDDETGELIHRRRRKFDFPEAAWRCAEEMLAARKEGA
tara:strand:- start:1517 stop:1840 length:324 start_codon:yes stop_codon:yes gene_type:complete